VSKPENNTTVSVDLLRRYDRPGPRYTSYPTAPMWNDSTTSDTYREALTKASRHGDNPLAIYCHIPFCKQRCYYCGCNTCVVKDREPINRYLDHLDREIDTVTESLENRRRVSQVHFGGGTPTYIGIKGLHRVTRRLRDSFEISDTCEISIEVDPRVTSPEDIRYFHTIGFSRISLGVQDFDVRVQKAVGRVQSQESVQAILAAAHETGYDGVNFDLIYGLPLQTPESFAQTLLTTVEMRPDRIALYSFAFLPKLRDNQEKIRPADLPDADAKYRLFSEAVQQFTQAGYLQIGMDHFALPEDELALAQRDGRLHRNFMGYTVQAAPEMIGLGMSSIGYIDNTFVQNISRLDAYEKTIETDGLAVFRGMKLSQDDLIRQYLISNLMCNFEVSFDVLRDRFGVEYKEYFGDDDPQLQPFIDDGFLIRENDGLRVTQLGRTFVRNIAMTFDAYLKNPERSVTFSRTI